VRNSSTEKHIFYQILGPFNETLCTMLTKVVLFLFAANRNHHDAFCFQIIHRRNNNVAIFSWWAIWSSNRKWECDAWCELRGWLSNWEQQHLLGSGTTMYGANYVDGSLALGANATITSYNS